ncbi:MAG TPA: hypothetical protein VH188_10645 [Chthoniobacterales bacterium]|jgi:hypothetical protein|nr:hypothetical protein [Chthoniobacterales bacterium]
MKIPKTAPALLVILVPVLIVCAATPTPQKTTPPFQTTPSGKNAAAPPAAPRPTPVQLASPSDQHVAIIQSGPSNGGPPPKPILYLMGTEAYSTGGKNYIRLRYDVLNKADYPAEMFAAAPALPPCGLNHNSSRTWVDFFDAAGHRIYGFCALGTPDDLGKIWIAYEEGTIPPSYVYIELNDRQTNTKYKSNLADTVL